MTAATIPPAGWVPCPDCDGDGTVIDPNPAPGERRHYDCLRCVEGRGYVRAPYPVPEPDYGDAVGDWPPR